ncbi:(2Fe-2S)-binding protein [candidate division WOR-3 bacterium JGI_Cruoil_03_44_89]|uniref:(2Fe-2S)-binding protein n=2 Tax=candidate division WOR-3 bacterium JGI_Cruoil_03_44_89 TaxID=1973748 RepID=A0A235BPI7_UNCW3|nr:MAG: (2Fe-2S)-binding protein [candidate division WOR-3 bacterium JGI_Cruoil_03_44_89]
MQIEVKINGVLKKLETSPGERLLDLLRRKGYKSVKRGCEEGECGACSIILEGKLVKSCLIFAPQVSGHSIITLEGLSPKGELHPIQQAFLEEGAVQCGFCTPGMILATKVLLDKNPHPSEKEIKEAISGNLCRCTGYVKIVKAIKRVGETLNKNV